MKATPTEWVKRVCSAPWKVRNSAPSCRMRLSLWNSRVFRRSMTTFSRSLSKPIEPWIGSRRYLFARAPSPGPSRAGRTGYASTETRHERFFQRTAAAGPLDSRRPVDSTGCMDEVRGTDLAFLYEQTKREATEGAMGKRGPTIAMIARRPAFSPWAALLLSLAAGLAVAAPPDTGVDAATEASPAALPRQTGDSVAVQLLLSADRLLLSRLQDP